MSDEPRQNDAESQRRRKELVALRPVAVLALAFGVNVLGVFYESWELYRYGLLMWFWFLFGIALSVSPALRRDFRWPWIAFALAALGFYVNTYMIVGISNSV